MLNKEFVFGLIHVQPISTHLINMLYWVDLFEMSYFELVVGQANKHIIDLFINCVNFQTE